MADLEERAAQRGGVLTRDDLDAAGLSSGAVQRAIDAGRVVRIRHGAYTTERYLASLGDDRWSRHALEVRAALSATATAGVAVASAASAAALHGFDMFGAPPPRPILIRPVDLSSNGRCSASTLVRTARLPDTHVTRLLGWPATTVARTLVDLARRQGSNVAVVAGDFALRNGLSIAELEAVLAECSRAPGIRRAREHLALCDARAESPLESLTRLVVHQGRLPTPELQYEVGPYRVDFCWPAFRLVLEVDGRSKYRGPDDLYAEKKREDWIRSRGFTVMRSGWQEVVYRPDQLCDRVRGPMTRAA